MFGESNPTADEMGIPEKNELIQDDAIRASLWHMIKTGELNSPIYNFDKIIEFCANDQSIKDDIDNFLLLGLAEDPKIHKKALELLDDINQDLEEMKEIKRRAA